MEFTMINIINFFKKASNKFRKYYETYKYDEFTIADKFRKQGAVIGRNCKFQIRELPEPFLIKIGDNVRVNSNVGFFTHDGASSIFRKDIPYLQHFGKITIGDNCFIGYGAMIMGGVTIGKNSIIGAGAVVGSNVEEGSVMVGNPAIKISTIEKYKQRCLDEYVKQGLNKLEYMFDGKSEIEAMHIMRSPAYRNELRKILAENTESKRL